MLEPQSDQTPLKVPCDPFEERVQKIGTEIFSRSHAEKGGLFDKDYWSSKMLDWSMKNLPFKIQMFRFVDVLPSLTHSEHVALHLREYFLSGEVQVPRFVRVALGVGTSNLWFSKLTAASVKSNVARMSSTFITGQDSKSAARTLEKLWNSGFAFTVDILGESVVAEGEALDYQRRYIELVQGLPELVNKWASQPHLEEGPLGKIPRANVSVKLSSLYSQIDPMAHEASVIAVKDRLRPILQAALEKKVFVNLDMEQNDLREITLSVAEEIFSESAFRSYPYFGLVIQAYLKGALKDIQRVKALAEKRGAPLTVRLVKGAYWDFEVAMALQRSWPIPVFTDKAATDANYEACTKMLLQSFPHLHLAMGSHNVRSLAYGMACAEALGLSKNALEVQMLYGMANNFKQAVKNMGYRIREYAPVGEMLPGMAYLVRRLLENTSNEGFLRAHGKEGVHNDRLLENPALRAGADASKKALDGSPDKKFQATDLENQHWGLPTEDMMSFINAPIRDFSVEAHRVSLEKALRAVRAELPIKVQLKGEAKAGRVSSSVVLKQVNPSCSKEIISHVHCATLEEAEAAMEACERNFKSWSKRPVLERTAMLRRAAELMATRKDELAALLTLEVGKNFRESDADVAEAIDFCTYYAASMEALANGLTLPSQPGEQNRYVYRARGTAVVISPWNFPLAILCGMTVAPLVAGNPVIMKPAEQSSAIALKLFEILLEAGVPPEVLHFLPGKGEEIGAYLVEHPKTHLINFTGSRAVGLKIMEVAAKAHPQQRHIKRVLAEMGGKNALLIDADADLDEAVVGVLASALGFQGQKCSALSRVIVLESAYEKLKTRLIEAITSMKYGPADNPASKIGPVIDEESQRRLLQVIERNRGQIVCSHPVPEELQTQGHFVPVTLFESTDFQSELGQQEFFGPVFCLFKVKTLDEGIAAMNDVDYALTGGVYSRSPVTLERVRSEIEVGNLYINRGITGALVARQPFGGYKLSGVGAKAGGPEYLRQFMEPCTQTENTMRRGFSPEI